MSKKKNNSFSYGKIYQILKENTEIKQLVSFLFGVKCIEDSPEFEIQNFIPDTYSNNNALSCIFNTFKKNTNIPTALPVFTFFAYLSAHLVKQGVTVNVADQIQGITPDIWLINLAESGSAKTYSKTRIENTIPKGEDGEPVVSANFEQCAGSAGFLRELEAKNKGFYFQDECAQLIKQMENLASPMAEIKKYLLMTYDHQDIQRRTKHESTVVRDPALVLLWLNTIDSFVKNISEESMLDGFCQRFMYVMSFKDDRRKMQDYSIYNSHAIEADIKKRVEEVFAYSLENKEFHIDRKALKFYKESFKNISEVQFSNEINESFYRRVMFNCFKYALMFHIILGKSNNKIDVEDISFALKVCVYHLYSVKELLMNKSRPTHKEIEKAKYIVDRARQIKLELKKENKEVTPRDIQRKIRKIATKEEAELVLSMI